MSTDVHADTADMAQLRDIPVETVLKGIDHGLIHLPTYRELYYRWERQQWRTEDLDFISDRIQWEDLLPDEQNEFLSNLAMFYQGEASVTDALTPFVQAAPDEAIRIFLTTQQVDEARHTVFFDRFFSEVIGLDSESIEERLATTRPFMNPSSQYILLDALTDVAERIRRDPGNLTDLVEGVTLYHIIIEGTMALAGQRYLLEQYRQENLFPALRAGMLALTRDESRHVIFGVKFLRDMIERDDAAQSIITTAIGRYGPAAIETLMPAEETIDILRSRGEDPWKGMRYAYDSLRKKIKVIGLNVEMPVTPLPQE